MCPGDRVCGLLLGIVVILSACNRDLRGNKAQMTQQQQPVSSAEVESVVREGPAWKAKTWRLRADRDLVAIESLGNSTLWIADSNHTLSKTTNDAESWLPVNLEVPHETKIIAIDFVDSLLGWAITTTTPRDVLDAQGLESSIWKTNDGGLHWQVQFTGKALSLTRVVLVNSQEGWVIGSKLIRRETLVNEDIVLRTTDQGQHWTDVSGVLNQSGAGGGVEDIYSRGSSRAVILTAAKEIFGTEDGGLNWLSMGRVPDEPLQTSAFRIGMLPNNHIWVLGATGGREGTWSMLAVRRDRNDWVKYKTYDVLLRDSIFLSDLEVVACGTIPSNNGVPLPDDSQRVGVILRSTDGGLNWTIIYRDPRAKSINALSVEPSGSIWAVGEAGLVIRLDPIGQ